jgi:hypothetical protein
LFVILNNLLHFEQRCYRAWPEMLARSPSVALRIDPAIGEFSDAVALKSFGDVPDDLSAL